MSRLIEKILFGTNDRRLSQSKADLALLTPIVDIPQIGKAYRSTAQACVNIVRNALDSEMLEAFARAYDAEDSAQRGEPDPWRADLVAQFRAENGEAAWAEWRDERLACARAALKAVGL